MSFIRPATRILQAFTGRGKVKQERVDKAEKIVDSVRGRIDISEFSDTHLVQIKAALDDIAAKKDHEEIIANIARSMANFKSIAGTFSDGNFVMMSAIMLRWVESVEVVDQDVVDVLQGYYHTMKKILKDDAFTPPQVELITKEMYDACERYFLKHPELDLTQEITNLNAFYAQEKDMEDIDLGALDAELSDEKLIGVEEDSKSSD